MEVSRPCPSGRLSPRSEASPVSERTGTYRGRRAAGTGRDYLSSRHREWDVRDMAVIRRNLHGGQRELHHRVEHRTSHLDAEIAAVPRVLDVDGDDQAVPARSRRDADETRAVSLALLLRGARLRCHRVSGKQSPRLTAPVVDKRDLLERWNQLGRDLRRHHPVSAWSLRRDVLARACRMTGNELRRYPDAAVRDRLVDIGHLDCRHADALAERDLIALVAVVAGPLRRGEQQARALAGQVKPRIRAEAERSE